MNVDAAGATLSCTRGAALSVDTAAVVSRTLAISMPSGRGWQAGRGARSCA